MKIWKLKAEVDKYDNLEPEKGLRGLHCQKYGYTKMSNAVNDLISILTGCKSCHRFEISNSLYGFGEKRRTGNVSRQGCGPAR